MADLIVSEDLALADQSRPMYSNISATFVHTQAHIQSDAYFKNYLLVFDSNFNTNRSYHATDSRSETANN